MKAYQAFIPLPTGEGGKACGVSVYSANFNPLLDAGPAFGKK
jgi:hypothetical protein